ncbi:MalY/PatB family protein [Pseudonocardia sp. DSM 110487]|uniref:MalY/PatB family protein n=1 Tax=Pseudonocardia sp. DSM 110487 TaxID=2865833 RepID=UPI002103E965|nr:aminotransferase class I/II-fold pyridoxal phosphate-dependent enzyme [Pseudonocardia sp. DSM 110487]
MAPVLDPLFDDLKIEDLRQRPGSKWRVDPDVLPAWVADMDYPVAPVIADAIEHTVRRGDLGYPRWEDGHPLRHAFADRMRERYSWPVDVADVREHTDVVQAVQVLLHLGTSAGDAVAVHTPTYPPFHHTVGAMGRKRVDVPFLRTSESWAANITGLADAVATHDCRALLLVNPHNPTGRVLTRDELGEIAAIARRHDLLVISDEIHAELTFAPHEHVPFASIDADTAARTVTLTSASKAFNLAGLRCSVAHFGPRRLLAVRDAEPTELYGAVSTLAVEAAVAAWRHGGDWQQRLLHVLDRNRRLVAEAVASWAADPEPMPEATYLYWFAADALGLGDDPVAEVLARARVLLSGGPIFGEDGRRYLRLNYATSAAVLQAVLNRLRALTAP